MASHTLASFPEELLAANKQIREQTSAYGSGNFINVLHEHLRDHEKMLTSWVNSKDNIYDSINTFFGKKH